jgi:hypothetical protein
MSDILDDFISKKKADSTFVSLEDGDSIVVKKLLSIKAGVKSGFDGKPKDVLDFQMEVETSEGVREKLFQNGTQSFAEEIQKKGVKIGDGFTLTRTGEGPKTRYTISAVVSASAATAPAA